MQQTIERVSTGIDKLDIKLNGGYPKGKGILTTGVAGSGKTIFALHYLHKSCEDGKKCIMIATEETPEDILIQAKMVGLDLSKYYNSKQLIIERVFESRSAKAEYMAKFGVRLEGLEVDLSLLIESIPKNIDVVIIDNIGVFTLRYTPIEFREQFDALNYILNDRGCTTLFVMDETAYNMTNQIADYSVYGYVKLLVKENPYTDKMERYMSIPKMRSTNVSPDMTVFEINSNGIKLHTANKS